MKKLSRKWLILEHYVQTAEEVMDGITVRLWKPRTMERLPAYKMRAVMRHYRNDYESFYRWDGKVKWFTGNPDWGFFDAQTSVCHDPHRKCVDIYVCALLIRPFSREADRHYEERMSLPWEDRLLLMWDSRTYDRENGYEPSPRGGIAYEKGSASYEDLFRVANKEDDILDGTAA